MSRRKFYSSGSTATTFGTLGDSNEGDPYSFALKKPEDDELAGIAGRSGGWKQKWRPKTAQAKESSSSSYNWRAALADKKKQAEEGKKKKWMEDDEAKEEVCWFGWCNGLATAIFGRCFWANVTFSFFLEPTHGSIM